jgi:hypothetical protein
LTLIVPVALRTARNKTDSAVRITHYPLTLWFSAKMAEASTPTKTKP